MKTKTIKKSDFDFEMFFDVLVDFIEANFGSGTPDASETLRYFYSFENEICNDKWKMDDFKNAIIQGGETIFFPFSSGLDMDGFVSLANGEALQLSGDDEAEGDVPNIGETDCYGFFLNLEKGKFKFDSAIAWGGMVSSIEQASHPKVDKEMNKFLKSFVKK